MDSLAPFLLGLLAAVVLLVPLFLRSRAAAARAGREAGVAGEELAGMKRRSAQIEEDQKALTEFVESFPEMARELFAGLKERQIPAALLHIVQQTFDPEALLVLVPRGSEDGQDHQFVVAAVAPEGGAVRSGQVLINGASGSLLASEAGLLGDGSLRADALAGFAPDLVAPLVYGRDTLGLIVLTRPRKAAGHARAALRLIARTGAQALHQAAIPSQLKLTAEMDSLTRVFNRQHMELAIAELIYRAACAAHDRGERDEASTPGLSVFLFDLDHFRHYNHANGHLAGDELLQTLGRIVPEWIRKDDLFGRFGADEFLLILPTNLAQALAAAGKIRTRVASHTFPFAGTQPMKAVTISGGVAEYPYHGRDAASLLHAAFEALLEAKRQGRNRVVAATRGKGLSTPSLASRPEEAKSA
jgi:diguanylate cyclase (GGDEF)-like protein